MEAKAGYQPRGSLQTDGGHNDRTQLQPRPQATLGRLSCFPSKPALAAPRAVGHTEPRPDRRKLRYKDSPVIDGFPKQGTQRGLLEPKQKSERLQMIRKLTGGLLWIVKNLETLAVIIVASLATVLHLLHKLDAEIVAAVTLATLALIGFAVLRDRLNRGALQESVKKLESLVTSLNNKIDRPLAESFFTHETNEKPILAEANEEVWSVQETGNLIFEHCKNEVIELLRKGSRLHLALTAPIETTARLMSLRNANLEPSSILQRAKLLQAHVKDVIDRTGSNAERLEIRYIPYPVDITCVIADPHHDVLSRRKGIVRQAGFKVTYAQKLDFTLSAAGSPTVFTHFYEESRRVFEHSSKIILITGPSRSGKTKLLESIVSEKMDSPELFFAVSPSLGERNKRLGFAVKFTGGAKPITFATRKGGESEYSIDSGVWAEILPKLEEALRRRQVIVLDEIGPIQLRTPDFEKFVWSVIEDVEATLFATIADDDSLHGILRRLKNHHRTTVLRLPEEREVTERQLLRELRASLRVARDMHRPLPGEAQ
jgi:nucleoside-triphosphatase THEP1